VKLVEVNVKKMLKLQGKAKASRRGYTIEVDWDRPSATFVVRMLVDGVWYVGEKTLDLDPPEARDREVRVDEEGLPYWPLPVGSETVREYDEEFLGDTCFGAAMAGLHAHLIDKAQEVIEGQPEPRRLHQEFLRWKAELVRRHRKMKRARLLSKYMGSDAELSAFSEEDQKEDLDLCELGRGGNKEYMEKVRFKRWYEKRINTRRYREKIAETEKEVNAAFKKWVEDFAGELEANGFVREAKGR
jgi:hypothetical protein